MSKKEEQQALLRAKYQAYKTFFTTEEGQIVLADLMRSSFFRTSTVGATPEETYYNEGKRNLVQQIIKTAKLKSKELDKLTDIIDHEDDLLFDIATDGGTDEI